MRYDKNQKDSKTDQILDLLLDVLLERQQLKNEMDLPESITAAPIEVARVVEVETASLSSQGQAASTFLEDNDDVSTIEEHEVEEDEEMETATSINSVQAGYIPEKLPSIHLDNMLKKLAIFLTLLIILINIPFNQYGTNLARAMPDTQSLVIRNGLVLKGSDEKIYVLEDNKKRWISTLDAFTEYGYQWRQVHEVDDAFLDQFENGRPIYLLQKCDQSPHVYAIENGEKRWIKNITAFQVAGFVWEDVRFTSCQRLRNIPDGPPIPPDAGDPPQP